MSTLAKRPESQIYYPESDGKPMAENTIQFRWITTIQGNLDLLFHDRPDVFVAGDNFWYPVEKKPKICMAPDVYVAFGRPKGDRGSYQQWEENNIPLAVVFEVLSPGNTFSELLEKFKFYRKFGVQEYYILNPQGRVVKLDIYEREGEHLKRRNPSKGWVSPLLGVRFVVSSPTVELFYPDGKPFLSFVELGELQKQTEKALQDERLKAENERNRAETEHNRAEKLAARLRELGIDPDAV